MVLLFLLFLWILVGFMFYELLYSFYGLKVHNSPTCSHMSKHLTLLLFLWTLLRLHNAYLYFIPFLKH